MSIISKIKSVNGDDIAITANSASFMRAVKTVCDNTVYKKVPIKDIILMSSTDDIAEDIGTAMHNGIGLAAKVEDKIYPMRGMSIPSLEQRAKVSGNALDKLPAEDKAYIYNKCLPTNKEDCYVCVVGDNISAFLSDGYVFIDPWLVFKRVNKKLDQYTPEFKLGTVTHGGFWATYELNDPKLAAEYAKAFGKGSDGKPVITVTSSNVGLSGVNIVPKIRYGRSELAIGSPLSTLHKGASSLDEVEKKIDQIYSLYEKSLKGVANLRNVEIEHPYHAFLNLAKALLLPKKYAKKAFEDWCFIHTPDEEGVTAFDLFLGLAEVVFYIRQDKAGEGMVVTAQENLARAINFKGWDDIDVERYLWKM